MVYESLKIDVGTKSQKLFDIED